VARQHTVGFESGINSAGALTYDGENNMATGVLFDVTNAGTVSYQNTVARNGGYAMSCAPGAGNYMQYRDVSHTSGEPMYCRFYYRQNAAASQLQQIFQWRLDGITMGDLRVGTDGAISLRDNAVAVIGSSAAGAIEPNRWYRIEAKLIFTTGSSIGTLEATLANEYDDAVTFASSSSATVGQPTVLNNATHRTGHLTTGETAATVYIDDVAFNDHTGTAQNGYPGPGNVTLLLPTADFSKGTGWVGGAAGATLYDGVNNVPPLGTTAAAGTDLTNIKNATNLGATAWYIATCQSLEAAGAPAGSTHRVIQALGRGSADDVTGTNNGLVWNLHDSAPTVAGDLEMTSVNGSEPTSWKTIRTTPQYMPNLASSAATLVAVGREAGATPTHIWDQMGLLTEWLPPRVQIASTRAVRHPLRLG
jgi:hypothetical protein